MAEHSRYRRGFEHIRAILDPAVESLAVFNRIQGQIERRYTGLKVEQFDTQASLESSLSRAAQIEHHLEDWRMTQAALDLQFFYQFLKGNRLMGMRCLRGRLHALEQLTECWVT